MSAEDGLPDDYDELPAKPTCPSCGGASDHLFDGPVRVRRDGQRSCSSCGHVWRRDEDIDRSKYNPGPRP
jgi:rubredoxin